MAQRIIRWTVTKMVEMIVKILQNKFDCFIVIEGNRGLGKSTLAIHLQRKVATAFKNIGSEDYKFYWSKSLIYTKKETKEYWHKWKSSGIADEMINVTFNRDFYNTEQKDIIKMINMNRDHCNFFIACVPQFQSLDNQIKNLCKIRITVVRRGLAVIQTPNRTIYVKDVWDSATNEKIERQWLQKGIKNPRYARLTTFRGLMKFYKLHPTAEGKYQKVKDKKRNLVAQEDMGIDSEEAKAKDPVQITLQMLRDGKVKNGTFIDGIAHVNGMKPQTLKDKLKRLLQNNAEPHQLSSYYWERKARADDEGSI